jgi:hypothetical protein
MPSSPQIVEDNVRPADPPSKQRHHSRLGRPDMDQEIRNKLRNVVTQCRKLLEDSVSQELEGKYGVFARKDQVTADPNAKMIHLTEEEEAARRDILDHFGHINAGALNPKEALDQLVREIAFTHLNRFCAYKMMEAREVFVGSLTSAGIWSVALPRFF